MAIQLTQSHHYNHEIKENDNSLQHALKSQDSDTSSDLEYNSDYVPDGSYKKFEWIKVSFRGIVKRIYNPKLENYEEFADELRKRFPQVGNNTIDLYYMVKIQDKERTEMIPILKDQDLWRQINDLRQNDQERVIKLQIDAYKSNKMKINRIQEDAQLYVQKRHNNEKFDRQRSFFEQVQEELIKRQSSHFQEEEKSLYSQHEQLIDNPNNRNIFFAQTSDNDEQGQVQHLYLEQEEEKAIEVDDSNNLKLDFSRLVIDKSMANSPKSNQNEGEGGRVQVNQMEFEELNLRLESEKDLEEEEINVVMKINNNQNKGNNKPKPKENPFEEAKHKVLQYHYENKDNESDEIIRKLQEEDRLNREKDQKMNKINQSALNKSSLLNRNSEVKVLAQVFLEPQYVIRKIQDFGQKKQTPSKFGFLKNIFMFKRRNEDPQQNLKKCTIINDRDCYKRCSPNEHIELSWEFENETDQQWPSIYYLRSYQKDQAIIKTKGLEFLVQKHEKYELKMNINIPAGVMHNKIILQFRFEDSNKIPFGQYLNAIIDIAPDHFEDVYRNQGQNQDKEAIYYQVAYDLNEQGFGDFERCYKIIQACKGDVKEAEKILSKIMIKETKSSDSD
ncbi:UNKNOWN [Stylonychia lemnae]|uniref:PB1 domain-containing protein n=1 Tax=Stylonychia lemnae TaxID=5949 RepID=A0A078AAN2_STYLE|nr:UNKNOWN [Stylonychia lemnae]|eukprot:CDW79340.1 UNKNOWN [Stylonychia lemnae]